MRFLRLPLFCLAIGIVVPSGNTEPIRVLETGFNSDKTTQMMRSFLRRKVHLALDRRLEELNSLETEQQIQSYQERLKKFFRGTVSLDSFEPSSLHPRITGTLHRKGYRIEKVIFESQPGFSVTGNLYLPDTSGPHPAILHPCGHSESGKAFEQYQKANQLFVKNGFVVFCYDPISQGERKQLLDEKGAGLYRASSEHQILGHAPVLLGRGLAGYMINDGVRALDYLASRPEVDPEMLGCTGNSGGGNMTAYLMALDARIKAAAPGCFMATTRTKNETPGPGDAEQNLFAQIRHGLDHPDFAIIRAPRPTLFLAATHDFVPIEGTWIGFRQAKQIYTKLGYPERVELTEAPEEHGFTRLLRESAARFFSRWLLGKDVAIIESQNFAIESEEDLRCTSEGQVLYDENERTVFDLNHEYAAKLKIAREKKWSALSPEERRQVVRAAINLEEGTLGLDAERKAGKGILFTTSDGLKLPAYLLGEGSERHLIFHDQGIAETMEEMAGTLAGEGRSLLGVDLCDIGETKTVNWRYYGADATIARMLGESYLQYRTAQILALAERERNEKGTDGSVHLHAYGELVPAALHAAAISPELFDSVQVHGGLQEWQSLMDDPQANGHIHNLVHGVMAHYDLSDLAALIPEGKLSWSFRDER